MWNINFRTKFRLIWTITIILILLILVFFVDFQHFCETVTGRVLQEAGNAFTINNSMIDFSNAHMLYATWIHFDKRCMCVWNVFYICIDNRVERVWNARRWKFNIFLCMWFVPVFPFENVHIHVYWHFWCTTAHSIIELPKIRHFVCNANDSNIF